MVCQASAVHPLNMDCPCSMMLQAAPTSPPCIFAGVRMCMAGYRLYSSRCASWVETELRPCPTALVAASGHWLTAAKGQAMAAGFMSSTPGCFQVSTPVLSQVLYHEIGKVITGIVPHWMQARESCLTPRETDPGS